MYCNEKCRETVVQMNEGREVDLESMMNASGSIANKKLTDLAVRARKSHQDEGMTFVANGRYFRINFLNVADSRQGCMLLMVLDGKQYEDQEQQEKYDFIMRNVVSIYDCIYILDFKQDTRTVIYSNLPYEKVGAVVNGLHEFYEDYSPKYIHPDDVNRWFEFIKRDNYIKDIAEQRDVSFYDVFRVKHPDGSYKWTEFQIVLFSDIQNRRALICEKPFYIDRITEIFKDKVKKAKPGEEGYNINDDLMTAIRHHSDIRFFWKDKNRRFLGVTDAFLKYYGFESQDVVLGKTDEDVGWHIDDVPFKSDEERVLEEGEIIRKNVGQNVVDGVTHYIAATKFPVYNNGEIIGLMGYMIDIEQDVESQDELKRESLIDPVTGFMNAYGQILTLTQLDDN
ncbi:PAS domain S-box, partial [Lachnospiraceae bacterium JC7]